MRRDWRRATIPQQTNEGAGFEQDKPSKERQRGGGGA